MARSTSNPESLDVNGWTSQSLQQLLDDRGPALKLYARQFCDAPDDAVQEAFVELVQRTSPPDRLLPWLYTVVKRRALNLARSESRRKKHQEDAMRQRPWFTIPNSDPSGAYNAGDCEVYLRRLGGLEREIVTARIWGELSFAEISQLVDQPLSTVHRRYQQALANLAAMMSVTETHGTSNANSEGSVEPEVPACFAADEPRRFGDKENLK